MAEQTPALEQQLTGAIEEIQTALRQAHQATATLQTLVPRLAQVTTLFDELATVINSGRAQLGAPAAPAYARPTLVATQPSAPTQEAKPAEDPWTQLADTFSEGGAPSVTPGLTSFRLELESKPGPLDLRSVDDAVTEHHAVKDVALIDYDGKKATLKVWIDESATPQDVRDALIEKAASLFGPENEVSVVAIEGEAA